MPCTQKTEARYNGQNGDDQDHLSDIKMYPSDSSLGNSTGYLDTLDHEHILQSYLGSDIDLAYSPEAKRVSLTSRLLKAFKKKSSVDRQHATMYEPHHEPTPPLPQPRRFVQSMYAKVPHKATAPSVSASTSSTSSTISRFNVTEQSAPSMRLSAPSLRYTFSVSSSSSSSSTSTSTPSLTPSSSTSSTQSSFRIINALQRFRRQHAAHSSLSTSTNTPSYSTPVSTPTPSFSLTDRLRARFSLGKTSPLRRSISLSSLTDTINNLPHCTTSTPSQSPHKLLSPRPSGYVSASHPPQPLPHPLKRHRRRRTGERRLPVMSWSSPPLPSSPLSPTLSPYANPSSYRPLRRPPIVQFSRTVQVYETFSKLDYDRGFDPDAACTRLTSELAQRIREELNKFKLYEMPVHELSRKYTHFFF